MSFAIKLAYQLWTNLSPSGAAKFYNTVSTVLMASVKGTVRNPDGSGLLWSNTSSPIIGYGFQDAEIKSGDVLYSNVLAWNASRLLAHMATVHGDHALAANLTASADAIQLEVNARLWNATAGVYMASNGVDQHNIDVWGNAMAGASGFTTREQSTAIFQFFKTHEADVFYEGQVREIPRGQQWEQARFVSGEDPLVSGVNVSAKAMATARTYQNGGYWATPHHHVLPFLAEHDRAMACRLLAATVASFRGHGIWEWVGPYYPAHHTGAPGYTASAANTYYASKQLRCWEQ